jgi:hypothetical protein
MVHTPVDRSSHSPRHNRKCHIAPLGVQQFFLLCRKDQINLSVLFHVSGRRGAQEAVGGPTGGRHVHGGAVNLHKVQHLYPPLPIHIQRAVAARSRGPGNTRTTGQHAQEGRQCPAPRHRAAHTPRLPILETCNSHLFSTPCSPHMRSRRLTWVCRSWRRGPDSPRP